MTRWSLVLLAGLAACNSEVSVRSNRLDSYEGNPRRILVLAANQLYPGDEGERVAPAIAEQLGRCGISTDVLAVAQQDKDSLPLDEPADPDKAFAVAAKARADSFRPDATMLVQRVRTKVLVRTSNYGRSASLRQVTFNVQFLDNASRKQVYRASVDLNIAPVALAAPGSEFARLLVQRLAEDRIVQGCPPPTKLP